MIEFSDVVVERGGRPIVGPVTFTIPAGQTVVLLGRSGSGKTTTLRLVNALVAPTRGRVRVDGRATTEWNVVQLRRRVGYVIQDAGLFPHFTVRRNIGIVPWLERWDHARRARREEELLELVGLPAEDFGERYPDQLSGGQQQRVGVARALAADPPVLLCDEPFGAVDPITRGELQTEFRALVERVHKTVVFVTHDVREAVTVGDRIVLLDDGRIRFDGSADAFRQSEDAHVAAFRAAL